MEVKRFESQVISGRNNLKMTEFASAPCVFCVCVCVCIPFCFVYVSHRFYTSKPSGIYLSIYLLKNNFLDRVNYLDEFLVYMPCHFSQHMHYTPFPERLLKHLLFLFSTCSPVLPSVTPPVAVRDTLCLRFLHHLPSC